MLICVEHEKGFITLGPGIHAQHKVHIGMCSMGSRWSIISSGGRLRLWPDCVVAQNDSNIRQSARYDKDCANF